MRVSDDPRVGTVLAGYRIESLLGLGGMSVVYLAEDLRLKRRVALKLLAAGLAEDESFRDRFLRESELAASIDHPNIVPIYEAGTTDDLLFIAMRYVEGRDLKERLRRGPLDPADAIGVARAGRERARCGARARPRPSRREAVQRAARHRRPPDGSDHVYLADFGLTKRMADEAGTGEDGASAGDDRLRRAGADRGRGDRRPRRRLLARLRALRVPRRAAAVPRRLGARGRVRAPRGGAAGAERAAARAAGGARRRDRQGAREGTGGALRELPRARAGGARGGRGRGEPAAGDAAARAAAGRAT